MAICHGTDEKSRMEKPSKEVGKSGVDDFVFNEIQIILAEKRTALSSLRSGIAIFALPLSVLSVLIATSKFYDIFHVLNLLIPLLLLNVGLIILGGYLVGHALIRLRHLDYLLKAIKQKYSVLAGFLS
jgi:hypothetical protein